MAISPAKEKILKKIREALSNPVPLPFPQSEGIQSVYKLSDEDSLVVFAEEFTKLQGKFAFCEDVADVQKQVMALIRERDWTKIYCSEEQIRALFGEIDFYEDLANCDVSFTGCEFTVARTGSLVLSAAQAKGRTASVYAPVHVCFAFTNDVVFDIKDALTALKEKYGESFPSFVSFASGPSRTADIEKTLVTGVHGPKEVFCFMSERNSS